MKKFWEQLKPQERRAVTAVGIIFFLVLNYFMVWPQFKQWNVNKARIAKAQTNIVTYQAESRHMDEYKRRIRGFDADVVPQEDQVIHFQNYIRDRALENGISIQNESPLRKVPAEFFTEQQVTLQTISSEAGLVNFLYSLGSSNSMVRVRTLNVHPADLNRFQLRSEVVIVASYQKTTPTVAPRPATPVEKPVTPAAKTAPPAPKSVTVSNKPGTPNTKRP